MLNRESNSPRTPRERGIAVLIVAVSMLVLIPVLGLAIDGGLAFVVRTRLSAAMDAAALAAGRGINLDNTVSLAQAQAITQAKNFFNANFPPGYLNTSPLAANRIVNVTFTLNNGSNGKPNGILTISVTGSVVAPTYFTQYMGKALGFPSLTVAASGTTTRKNLVMELVLDKSTSMGSRTTSGIPSGIGTTSCDAMVYSTVLFTKYFSPYDSLGEISFDATATDDYTSTTTWYGTGSSSIANKIGAITCQSNTNTTAALYKAYKDIVAVGEPLAQNVIVLFTDGVPNAVNATFPVRNQVDSRVGPATSPTVTTPAGSQNVTNCAANNTNTCTNMPVCTSTANLTVSGVITQTSGFDVNSGSRGGPYRMITGDSPSTPTSVPSGCPSTDDAFTSQTIAYIPDSDYFGNSMHSPPIAGNSPTYTPTLSIPWDGWLYQVNHYTAPSGTPITSGNSAEKNLGDFFSPNYPVGTHLTFPSTETTQFASNFFSSGPYVNKFRPDLDNAIGVASMNSATNEAYTIRNDTTYNITIDTVYLQGNMGDPVDRAFLQIVTNQPNIEPILYNPTAAAYASPYYEKSQQQGLWMATATTTQLQTMFQQIASSLLRISQ